MLSGYWYIKVVKCVQKKTAFHCKNGTVKINLMLFSRINVPFVFQIMAKFLFKDLKFVHIYIDDVVIGTRSLQKI